MTRTGPNDARRVVWAIGEFLTYLFHVFFNILTNVLFTYSRNIQSLGAGRSEMTRMGANDEFAPYFYLFFVIFNI